ncbi:hypothetical protein [Croceitalea vernalis]|uniref:Uncharacterized protein n=1 Tax=Croceitalea vernalis TaxID=3075599 RepID=A0ABU3BLC8_9FLAO|nr:hypothetical protein [Croceitalea sp. P007]MDT0622952.1 hypothetical protein [Croceitalea sp. P007]
MFKYVLITSLIIVFISCRDSKKTSLKSQKNDVEKTDNVIRDTNGWVIMNEIGVKDFLNELKIRENEQKKLNILSTLGEAPLDWLNIDDLEFLISQIESEEKAKCVMRAISSHIPNPENITIGDQAISILESYRRNEQYPNGLTICGKYDAGKVKEIRTWWAEKKR